MKAYTDVEQSKVLAKILPLESADMSYRPYREEGGIPDYHLDLCPYVFASWIGVPAWSLAALLDYLKQHYYVKLDHDGISWSITCIEHDTAKKYTSSMFDDPIDACWGIILRLNKENHLINEPSTI